MVKLSYFPIGVARPSTEDLRIIEARIETTYICISRLVKYKWAIYLRCYMIEHSVYMVYTRIQ